jgi:hypothetical protein
MSDNGLPFTSLFLLVLGFVDRVPAWIQIIGILIGAIWALIQIIDKLRHWNKK